VFRQAVSLRDEVRFGDGRDEMIAELADQRRMRRLDVFRTLVGGLDIRPKIRAGEPHPATP